MPLLDPANTASSSTQGYTELPFPPLTRSHILNCSYHSWYPRYRSLTPKARLIALSPAFLSYLRADGIILPPDPPSASPPLHPDPLTPPPSDSSNTSDSDDENDADPSAEWREIHEQVISVIQELGGSVVPKLNWSAPKDATWINATNSMDCRSASDVYLLLKSSDFVTHDLEQAWVGCEDSEADESDGGYDGPLDDDVDEEYAERVVEGRDQDRRNRAKADESGSSTEKKDSIPYHLVLRKTIPSLNPALEFRCFVRMRQLLCICQRDMNHYSFLHDLLPKFRALILDFFTRHLQRSFQDSDFVFDVYIPEGYKKVWLMDINPWAVRTDPLLFSWLDLLTRPPPEMAVANALRLEVNGNGREGLAGETPRAEQIVSGDDSEDEDVEEVYIPEFKLVNRDDPEAYAFNSTKYSAHKLPKDVVDAGLDGGEGVKEFLTQWRDILRRQEAEDGHDDE